MTSLRGLSGAFEVLHLAHDILRLSGLCLTLHLHPCADLGKPARGDLSTLRGFSALGKAALSMPEITSRSSGRDLSETLTAAFAVVTLN